MMTQNTDNPSLELPILDGDQSVRLEADAIELSKGRAVVVVTISRADGTKTQATFAMVPARA